MVSTTIEYNPRQHMPIGEATLLTGYDQPKLERLISESGNSVHIYNGNGTAFLNRLDLGRLVHYASKNGKAQEKGIHVERYFTDGKSDPFASVGEYEIRKVGITDDNGKVIFEADVEAPKSWGDTAVTIAANKYFFRPKEASWAAKIKEKTGKPSESSPKHIFSRVSRFFANWGEKLGYFKTPEEKQAFEDELDHIQVNQMAAFNSPVYFNAGLWDMYGIPGAVGIRFAKDPKTGEVIRITDGCYTRPQTHACFIKGPEDDLESLLKHVVDEGSVFADGSGIGQDLSYIRGKDEPLSSGGKASGPMSFFQLYDKTGGIIQSGGKTRRAARMTTMRYWHPDVMEFIEGKVEEDHKALDLIKMGWEAGFEGEAYKTVAFQNTNLSVRLDDHFFQQLNKGGKIQLRFIKSGEVAGEIEADHLLKKIAFGSWRIGDPAVQYESKIQEMNPCKNSGEIDSTNPCSEYMFLNNTSCNLNSINLLRFTDQQGNFMIEPFLHTVRIMTIAADIANDAASYPNEDIARISPEFRTIGNGYANLGALLMRRGVPYDSNEGRAIASAITSLLHAESYRVSAELARSMGPFTHFELNRKPMLEVVKKHHASADKIGNWPEVYGENFSTKSVKGLEEIIETSKRRMEEALRLGEEYGFRNAQVTVLAPTGTIARLMGCDTTGVEPSDALVISKNLAGGGKLDLVVEEVPNALRNLGYQEQDVKRIIDYMLKHKTVEAAPGLNPNHYPIFDTAFSSKATGRTIDFRGHIKMLGATQPFISGAISKTNNLPKRATVKEIYDGYVLGHELGLKAVSVYRYDSKPVTVLTFGDDKQDHELKRGEKREPKKTRIGPHLEVSIGSHKFHIRASEYDDGTVADIFVDTADFGSELRGMIGLSSVLISTAIKRGVKLKDITAKLKGQSFEPHGATDHEYIKIAKSLPDFLGRWLEVEYLGNLEAATKKELVNIESLRGVQNGAIKVYQRENFDEWNFESVIKDQETGGFVKAEEDEITRLLNNGTQLNARRSSNLGPMCKCGRFMRIVKANCYECDCGKTYGGCGG